MESMGLSKGQKKRLYGEQATTQAAPAPKPDAPAQPGPRVITDYSRGELVATPESGSSYIFLGVAFVITLLFGVYYHLMLLPGVSNAAGATAPELMTWFTTDHLQRVANGLGVDGLQEYQVLHRSTGLIFPLIFAFTWWNMVRASKFELLVGRLMLAIPVAYAAVFIAGGFAIDMALAAPPGRYRQACGPVGSSALGVAGALLRPAGYHGGAAGTRQGRRLLPRGTTRPVAARVPPRGTATPHPGHPLAEWPVLVVLA